MAVRTKYNVSRFYIEGFGHQLMADTVTSVDIFHAVFFCKCISNMEMTGVIHLACRNKVVIDQNHFIRIPQFLKSHFFKFFCHKRDKNIVNHDAVHIDRYDISRMNVMAYIAAYNFFNDCLSHNQSSSPFRRRMAFTRPPALIISIRFCGREAIGNS